MPGSASRAVKIPDSIPEGHLRAWLVLLADLRLGAGMPSLAKVSKQAGNCGRDLSTATVRRLLVGETTSMGPALALAYTLAEMDTRPAQWKSSYNWDTFDRHIRLMLLSASSEVGGEPNTVTSKQPDSATQWSIAVSTEHEYTSSEHEQTVSVTDYTALRELAHLMRLWRRRAGCPSLDRITQQTRAYLPGVTIHDVRVILWGNDPITEVLASAVARALSDLGPRCVRNDYFPVLLQFLERMEAEGSLLPDPRFQQNPAGARGLQQPPP